MLAALDLAAAAADERHRQREVIVRVAVAHVAAVDEQRVVEHRAVAVRRVLELLHEPRERARVIESARAASRSSFAALFW